MMISAAADAPDIAVLDGWSPDAPPRASMHAGYLTLENRTGRTVTIVSAESPFYGSASLHRSTIEAGQVVMEEPSSIDVEAGQRLIFEPGGLHLMLMGPKGRRQIGDKIPFKFHTRDGASIHGILVVKPR
jgi:copper(I)-binding protein